MHAAKFVLDIKLIIIMIIILFYTQRSSTEMAVNRNISYATTENLMVVNRNISYVTTAPSTASGGQLSEAQHEDYSHLQH
jgi:hypothetical protein